MLYTVLKKVKKTIVYAIYGTATRISPELNTQLHFLWVHKHLANLKNPITFAEKISWLKLYDYATDPLVKQCADKLRVREYVKEKGLEHLLNPLIAVYQYPEEIEWNYLPDKFVLKWNYGCGYNLLCPDKKLLHIKKAEKQLTAWGKENYWLYNAELQYNIEDKRILCETFLESEEPEGLLDYKCYCFHGKVLAILILARSETNGTAAVFMSPEWELISDVSNKYKRVILPEKPECLDEMIKAAEVLAEPFPFVRIDFYQQDGRAVFGEMTFTPAAGINPAETVISEKTMGDSLCLSV